MGEGRITYKTLAGKSTANRLVGSLDVGIKAMLEWILEKIGVI